MDFLLRLFLSLRFLLLALFTKVSDRKGEKDHSMEETGKQTTSKALDAPSAHQETTRGEGRLFPRVGEEERSFQPRWIYSSMLPNSPTASWSRLRTDPNLRADIPSRSVEVAIYTPTTSPVCSPTTSNSLERSEDMTEDSTTPGRGTASNFTHSQGTDDATATTILQPGHGRNSEQPQNMW